jgi:hypothetical protein
MMNKTQYALHVGCSRQRVGQWVAEGLPCNIRGDLILLRHMFGGLSATRILRSVLVLGSR